MRTGVTEVCEIDLAGATASAHRVVGSRRLDPLERRVGAMIARVLGGFAAVLLPSFLFSSLLVLTAAAAESNPAIESVDVIFVLDNSGSMRENDPEFLTRAAVANFASALAANPDIDARMAVILFDGQARLVRELNPITEHESDRSLDRALAELDFSGQRTNSPAGIERALYEFRQRGRDDARRAIIFLTDGKIDTGDPRYDLEASRWLREDLASESESSGIRIFGVAFTDAADYQLMQALARRTHARYYRALEASQLPGVVDEMVAAIAAADFDEPALAEATRLSPSAEESQPAPDVSAAPLPRDEGSVFSLRSLVPVAILLVAGTLVWRHRSRVPAIDPVSEQASQDLDAPQAQLLDLGGQLGTTGAIFQLARGRTRIGRDPHNDIVLDDDTISSEHAVIEVHDGRYWIEDRRSTNGTRVGERRLTPDQREQLKGGDHIRLAEIDLMFVHAGYVPAGGTVFLHSTTGPPASWNVDPASPSERRVPERDASRGAVSSGNESQGLERETAGRAPSEEPVSAKPGQLALLPDPPKESDDAARPESVGESRGESAPSDSSAAGIRVESIEGSDSESKDVERYRSGLDYHLERVAELSPAFATFVERAFDDDIRSALATAAHDLIADATSTDRVLQTVYTFDRVRYVICGIPGEMDRARDLFIETFGGFTRMLTEQLQAESFRTDRCEILAVLTFGRGETPWVSLSIVPDEGQDPRIDLLSYEFLTDRERREIEPGDSSDVSQSGLG